MFGKRVLFLVFGTWTAYSDVFGVRAAFCTVCWVCSLFCTVLQRTDTLGTMAFPTTMRNLRRDVLGAGLPGPPRASRATAGLGTDMLGIEVGFPDHLGPQNGRVGNRGLSRPPPTSERTCGKPGGSHTILSGRTDVWGTRSFLGLRMDTLGTGGFPATTLRPRMDILATGTC